MGTAAGPPHETFANSSVNGSTTARNLMKEGAQRAHQRKAKRTGCAGNKDFHERNSFEV